ncbi:hypothetical protein RFI_02281 [Reticulomyxa filosa]|uniref:Cyclic nucleotide-binding domain-containing protein n=1 Tax=Reticulomyxa filosa TaxID=46433 RepID=X6P9L3_RETFI|nr:hypothetical protein RFI_02281 [Reticulomyxa filosa]|eukprot:ETO34808.1 hypothetical protein RFI_02281 [Reticulomyxa filosa]
MFKTEKLDLDGKAKILARYLEKVPLLARLSLSERHRLGLLFRDRSYSKGMEIIRQGDKGNEFYIIVEGEVTVQLFNESKKTHENVAVLKPGDYFGETALLTSNRRTATIRAMDTVVVLVLDKDSFLRVFGEERMRVNFGKRGVECNVNRIQMDNKKNKKAISAEDTAPKKKIQQKRPSHLKTNKSDATKELIAAAVENNVLFAALDEDQIARIVDVMWELEVKKGYQLITQGEAGDNFYVVESGVFDVYVMKNGVEKLVATRTAQESFGELALMYNSPRSATVRVKFPFNCIINTQ